MVMQVQHPARDARRLCSHRWLRCCVWQSNPSFSNANSPFAWHHHNVAVSLPVLIVVFLNLHMWPYAGEHRHADTCMHALQDVLYLAAAPTDIPTVYMVRLPNPNRFLHPLHLYTIAAMPPSSACSACLVRSLTGGV